MDNVTVKVDVEEVNRLLSELRLTDRQARTAFRRGLRSSGGIVSQEVKRNLRGVGRNTKNLTRFVQVKVNRNSAGVTVSIAQRRGARYEANLGKRGIANKSFVLKFFEKGTDYRFNKYTKRKGGVPLAKKRYTGFIKASYFFEQAEESKAKEAQEALNGYIIKYIKRIADKRDAKQQAT